MGFFDRAARALGAASQAWTFESDDDVPLQELSKAFAERGLGLPEATEEKPRGMFHDPYSIMDWGGWRQRPSVLTYDTLRTMSIQCAPIAAIITLRVNQLSQFARPQQGDYDRGYRVVLRNRRDRFRSMSKAEQKRASEIEKMLETTGVLLPTEQPSNRDSFRTFLRKGVRDVLTYDQLAFEKLRDRQERVSRFICLPSETIRPAVLDVEHVDVQRAADRVAYVQVYENTVIAEFAQRDLAWCIMNPRSDLRVNGFGFSPIEQMTRLVTAWLYGFEYNQKFFSQGSAIKGLLNVKGTVPDRQMRAFRRMWYAQISGMANAWRTPILNSEDVQWISMHSNNREMEFSSWMDWVTKLTCAIYGVDPIEINFQFGNTGQSSALNEGNNENKIVESKDKGLHPLVDFFQDTINTHLVWELEPEFEFVFAGIDSRAASEEREARTEESAAYKTINEVRAEMNLPKLPTGDVIRDPNWIQWATAQQQAAQGQQDPNAAPQDPNAIPAPGGDGAQQDDEEDGLLSAQSANENDSAHEFEEDDDLLHHEYAKAESLLRDLRKAVERTSHTATTQTIHIEV